MRLLKRSTLRGYVREVEIFKDHAGKVSALLTSVWRERGHDDQSRRTGRH